MATHYQIDSADVAEHAAAHGVSPETMRDRPCLATDGDSTDDYDLVTCPDCIDAGFGPEPATYRIDGDPESDSTIAELRVTNKDAPTELFDELSALPVGGRTYLDCGGGATPIERVS